MTKKTFLVSFLSQEVFLEKNDVDIFCFIPFPYVFFHGAQNVFLHYFYDKGCNDLGCQ